MSENSLREITQQIDHLAESYDIHHSNLAGILNHVKNERDALNQMESELTQSRAESALLVEALLDTREMKKEVEGVDCWCFQPDRYNARCYETPYCQRARAALTTLPDQVKELLRIRDAAMKRVRHGHNDTCACMLIDGESCTCGHDELVRAVRGSDSAAMKSDQEGGEPKE